VAKGNFNKTKCRRSREGHVDFSHFLTVKSHEHDGGAEVDVKSRCMGSMNGLQIVTDNAIFCS
jgi:hypothetical protein